MKKSSFVAMILGTISSSFFALGIVMALVPEFGAFNLGILLGGVGLILSLVALCVWRKMEKKTPIHLTKKAIGCTILGVIGVFSIGIGMSMTMVWNLMIPGIIVGFVGIIFIISLVPIMKGIK